MMFTMPKQKTKGLFRIFFPDMLYVQKESLLLAA